MRIGYLLLLCAIIFSSDAFALYKCIDESGKVSYQGKRCPKVPTSDSTSKTQTVKQGPSDIKYVDINLPGDSSISVPLPSDWEVNISQSNKLRRPTLKAKPRNGTELTLLMTPIPLKESLSAEDKKEFLKQISSEIRAKYHSYESTKELDSTPIQQEMTGSIGHLYTFADENLKNMETLPKGESIYLNTGTIIIENILVTTTILTNDISTDNFKKALAAVHFITTGVAKQGTFKVRLENPDVEIEIPELPAIKLEQHPMSAAKPHLRLLGNLDPYNISVITPTADEGMTAAECATSSGGSIAEQYGLDKSKINLMQAEDNHTFSMYFPLSLSQIKQGMYQLNAYLFSAHAGTHCIMVHISMVSMDKDEINTWLKGFPQARIRSY